MNQSKSVTRRIRMITRSAALATLALSLALVGCGSKEETIADGKLNVVTTFYPLHFLAEAIGGEDARVINLVPAGVDPHDWTPKSKDLKIASEAQLFIYNGAGLEGWTDEFLKGLPSDSKLLRVEASKGIGLITADGHDHDTDTHEHSTDTHDHDTDTHEHSTDTHDHNTDTHEHSTDTHDHDTDTHDHDTDTHNHGTLNVDPHTWVSPKSALQMATNIRDAFIQTDPANEADYERRFETLQAELTSLDEAFAAALAPYQGRDIVVSHQAFAYLCRDYGLIQTSVMGLSPDAEPQARDMIRIIKHIKEKQIRYIFFEALASNSLAETIAQETGAKTLVLNPIEGLTPEQERAGENYVTIMRENLQNLQKALQ